MQVRKDSLDARILFITRTLLKTSQSLPTRTSQPQPRGQPFWPFGRKQPKINGFGNLLLVQENSCAFGSNWAIFGHFGQTHSGGGFGAKHQSSPPPGVGSDDTALSTWFPRWWGLKVDIAILQPGFWEFSPKNSIHIDQFCENNLVNLEFRLCHCLTCVHINRAKNLFAQ